MKGLIDAVKWNDDGLAAAIAQESATGEVLMLAWMNRESLALTIETGEAVYWSRSRQQLWHKGESSGHTQRVDEMRLDCDGDAILLRVTQHGGISCHTGRRSCFFRRREGDEWRAVEPVVRDPEEIYGNR